ncbi:hypothetical protein GSF22_24675 [Micromonospora echinofusca]|uniref:Uncharacterized protein n=1 Tax=Micromonospora echinofusca TaxID=47858 RepID=A0ABS3VX92_MICEH|nr:hypothetical protein [Micromonospora echinofusca]
MAQTAREQGREVVTEATRQARNLYGEARDQLTTQAGTQQRRAAGGLRSLADEMRTMAEQGGQTGPVSELARQAADRVHGVAGWLEEREPGDLVAEVRDYARRNPGTFLVGAAVLGVLAGRLTRNVAAAGDGGQQPLSTGTAGFSSAETVPLAGYADQRAYAEEYAYADERTAVLPPATPVPPAGGVLPPSPPVPPNGTTPGGLPPATRTDPLPGVPSSGVQR